MVWTKEQKRAARLAASPAFPRPHGPTPFGCTWNMSCGGWFKDGEEVTIVRDRKRIEDQVMVFSLFSWWV